jgi:hypothetical protein
MGLGPSSLPGWVFKGTPTRTYTIELPTTSTSAPSEEQAQEQEQAEESRKTPDGWEYLTAEQVRELEPRVAGEIARQLRERETGGKVQVAVLPTK